MAVQGASTGNSSAPANAADIASNQIPTGAISASSWEAQFLTALQNAVNQKFGANITIPLTQANAAILDAWTSSEGTLGSNNPFAISGMHPGATSCLAQCGSSSPVMAYDSMADGVNANAAFMVSNGIDSTHPWGYATIAKYLSQNTSSANAQEIAGNAESVFTSINQSGWCRGCQGGIYPTALRSLIDRWSQGNFTLSQAGAATPTSATGTAAQVAGGAVSTAAGSVSSWIAPLTKALSTITNKLFWIRVGYGLLGVVLIVVGISFILSETKAGKEVGTAAAAAALA